MMSGMTVSLRRFRLGLPKLGLLGPVGMCDFVVVFFYFFLHVLVDYFLVFVLDTVTTI